MLLNVACLGAPGLLLLGFQFDPPPLIFAISILGYWLFVPIFLSVLLLSRTARWKVAARRALLGWALTVIMIPVVDLMV